MKKIISSAEINEPRYLVRRRINLVRKLSATSELSADDIDELINVDGMWLAHPGKDYQGLRCYLLLTCFDILGQLTTEWADFYTWLSDKMNIDPHTLHPMEADGQTAEPPKNLYHNYSKDHATRNNFYYYINTVISQPRRQELLDNVRIIKKSKLTDRILPCPISESEKLKILFDIRCSYMLKGSPVPARFDQVPTMDGEQNDDVVTNHYYVIQWSPKLIIDILEEVLNRENRI